MIEHDFKKGDKVIYDGCNCTITSIDDFWAGVWDGYNTYYAKIEHLKPYKNKDMKQIDLRNTKIYLSNEEDRATFQEAVFKLGVRWLSGSNQVKNTKSPFIFIDKNMAMFCSNAPKTFKLSVHDQVFLSDIVEMSKTQI